MARSRKPSASQLELLREMAAGYDRHIIYNPYALGWWLTDKGRGLAEQHDLFEARA